VPPAAASPWGWALGVAEALAGEPGSFDDVSEKVMYPARKPTTRKTVAVMTVSLFIRIAYDSLLQSIARSWRASTETKELSLLSRQFSASFARVLF
jgi:hypothetical protein